MEKQESKSLVVDLRKRIEKEKSIDSEVTEVVVGGRYERIRRTITNPLTITKEEMDQLVVLRQLLIKYPGITQEDLDEMLDSELADLEFLRKVNGMLSDFAEELRDHGVYSVAGYYAAKVDISEQVKRTLP